jgi:glucose-6-phosphate 1-dehydrogenase
MAFDLVLFGGTGDLTWRKLMPALFQAWRHGKLPEGGRIVAVSRQEFSDDAYRAWIKERFAEVEDAKRPSDEEFDGFAALLHYLRLDLSQAADYARLKDWLASPVGRATPADVTVMFLATSPDLFPVVCAQLGVVGLNGPNVRVVLEKPLGHDLASAQRINRVVRSVFSEAQEYRIDHYLGKPAVQNLMALRFGNVLFEPLWRRECIANIQITLAESMGVGTRGDFYSRTGALRDMIQNHALQLLTMVTMEPPSRMVADAIRDEKLKVLRSLKPFGADSVGRDVVRGQYRAGSVDGKAVPGFLEEDKVPAGSTTETFVALRTEVQNWRWAGVPFYLRTGKRLAERDAQIVVNFRRTPHTLFPGSNPPNKLVIKLQPEDGLELHLLAAKGAGEAEALAPVSAPTSGCCSTSSPAGSTCSFAATSRKRRGALSSRSSRSGAARMPRRVRTRPEPGGQRRRAPWSRATASPGRKSSRRLCRVARAPQESRPRIGFLSGPLGGISTIFSSVSSSL